MIPYCVVIWSLLAPGGDDRIGEMSPPWQGDRPTHGLIVPVATSRRFIMTSHNVTPFRRPSTTRSERPRQRRRAEMCGAGHNKRTYVFPMHRRGRPTLLPEVAYGQPVTGHRTACVSRCTCVFYLMVLAEVAAKPFSSPSPIAYLA
jgi:hypothetical protein